jgi:hypothetical protein
MAPTLVRRCDATLGSRGPRLAAAAGAAVALLLTSSWAAANDELAMTYPGSNCKWYGPQSLDNDFTYSGGNSTGIKNGSGSAKKVVCPAARRGNHGGQNSGISEAFLTYSGGSTAWASSNCSLRATGENGTAQEEWEAPSPTLGADGIVWGTWAVPNLASYAFYCQYMPAGEWIFKYDIVENGGVFEAETSAVTIVTPGSACRYYGPQASDDVLDPYGGNATGMKNTGSAVGVTCPLIREDAGDIWNNYYRLSAKTDESAGWQNSDCVFAISSWNGASTWNLSMAYTNVGPGAGFTSGWLNAAGEEYASMAMHCPTFRAGGWIYNTRLERVPDL